MGRQGREVRRREDHYGDRDLMTLQQLMGHLIDRVPLPRNQNQVVVEVPDSVRRLPPSDSAHPIVLQVATVQVVGDKIVLVTEAPDADHA